MNAIRCFIDRGVGRGALGLIRTRDATYTDISWWSGSPTMILNTNDSLDPCAESLTVTHLG